MKYAGIRKLSVVMAACLTMLTVSCGVPGKGGAGAEKDGGEQRQSFAEAHDAFQTTLARQESDDDPIPEPPEGLFDLVKYPSKVGELSGYVSCDPGDGQKHPLIIWVVGGWGSAMGDFPWTYPEWENDQTGSAFWRSGVLTMYPSFRGGNGNPGHYETLFGEVDDIISAYEYAASLPYVDPERIYLGGHSTGGTRALLASEYSDKFRAVFCFGAVDDIRYHNNSQFTFDTNKEEEYEMRSPIHWLEDIKKPTFLIEGSEGNGTNLKRIQEATDNENIHCYVLEGADHFAPLGPITPLLAEKILADTGATSSITITQEELEAAMAGEPEVPLPVMTGCSEETSGVSFSYPYLWEMEEVTDANNYEVVFYSPYDEYNVWDMANMYFDLYGEYEGGDLLKDMTESLEADGLTVEQTEIAGHTAIDAQGQQMDSTGAVFHNRYVLLEIEGGYVSFDFFIHEDFGSDADELFQTIIDSITFEQAEPEE